MFRLCLICCLLTAPAAAQQAVPPKKTIECYCTDRTGARVDMGGLTCIDVGETPYMARCVMVLNNPAWKKIQDGCVSSGLRMSRWVQPPRG